MGKRWHGEPGIFPCVSGWSLKSLPTSLSGQPEVVLVVFYRWGKSDIKRLSWFNSWKELMWTDLDVKDNELNMGSRFHLSHRDLWLSKVGPPPWWPHNVCPCPVWQCCFLQLVRDRAEGCEGLKPPHSWGLLVLRSWLSTCMFEVCSASGTCVRQCCLLVSTCFPG